MITICSTKNRKDVLEYFQEHFNITKDTFTGYELYEDKKGRIFLGTPELPQDLRIVAPGLQIATIDKTVKPSTTLLQLIGKKIKKNTIMLTQQQAIQFIRGEDIELEKEQMQGYVLLKYKEHPLGCGHYKNGIIKNMLPKGRKINIKFIE